MLSDKAKQMMLEVYERERCGEIDIDRRNNLLRIIQESSEFIQSNIERLERLHKEGKLSDEDFEKQVKAWKAREGNYEANVKEEQLKKEREEKTLQAKSKKLVNRIGNKVSSTIKGRRSNQPMNRTATATENVLNDEEYFTMRNALYEKEQSGEIDIETRNRLVSRLDSIYLSGI